ncbi:hypothetical protein [Nocardia sp. NPDC052566]|uniref:hypothetical protein n=1 Tax=Nocardia sp. NPDC052566 TaxID=3364330 RepID=UPI0037C6E1EA
MVLDEVWRELDGVEPLSGPQGGPLRRTVKLILDPLVIRPVQHPACAGPLLSADGAVLLAARIHASADVLRATAAWFTVLKQVRRGMRITEGHPQDLYFRKCFELAHLSGMPDALRDNGTAEEALREIHGYAAGRTTQALKDYVAEQARADELTGLIEVAWRRRPLVDTAFEDRSRQFAALLDACAAARLQQYGAKPVLLTSLIDQRAGTHYGIGLWHDESDPTARELGLTAHPVPQRPELGASASKADMGRAFDRTIFERVFTALQASSDRAELPPIPELVTTEIARGCAPWALLDESLRVAATAGAVLAVGLSPFPEQVPSMPIAGDGERGRNADLRAAPREPESIPRQPWGTTAHQVVNNRWRREAYVLQARRLAVHATPTESPLSAIAAELRTPWRPYLRRLWVRLHGRDVRELSVSLPDELWDLLDGVARSVILDHRMRVKQALSVSATVREPESRAS